METEQDVVLKWSITGFLRDVNPKHIRKAAERLEAAARQMTGSCNWSLLDNELVAMHREGLYSRSVNSR